MQPQRPEERAASPKSDATHSSSANGLAHRNKHVKWEGDISVDDHGGISFHNSTSGLHESHPMAMDSILSPATPTEEQQAKHELVANAGHQRSLETYAIAHSAPKVDVPKEISEELLRYHWCWMHPLFLFVYRPAFTRAMGMVDYSTPSAPDPVYFSGTLLKVIHAHCARMLNHDVYQQHYQATTNGPTPMTTSLSAQEFMAKMLDEASVGIGMDVLKPSSVPTIQALLQQSARDIVFGRSSQAWTFAGIAFRMASDMGIHLPTDKLQSFVKSLSAEDIEIRKRLFWSCYTWDKILSLYLGRMPGKHNQPSTDNTDCIGFTHPATDDVPLTFMDDYSDSELWAPYYGETPKPDNAQAPNYPPTPGYVVSCFRQLCRLCIILNDLLQNIYSPEATARRDDEENSAEAKAANEEPFIKLSRELRDWLVALPAHLRIAPDRMPLLALPPHIMSLNLLYHTMVILLHRPVILGARDPTQQAPARSFQACVQATMAIHDLLMLQRNTFGLSHVSYLNAYAAYIAATVALLRFEREYRAGDDPELAAKRTCLSFLIDVLGRAATGMPALLKSDAIIRKRKQAVIDRHMPMPFTMSTQDMPMSTTTYQPLPLPYTTQASTETTQPFISPTQWESDMRTSLYSPPSTDGMVDFLPAFPGQQFPVTLGRENSFGISDVDQVSRMGLMGFNLDPQPRVNIDMQANTGWGMDMQ